MSGQGRESHRQVSINLEPEQGGHENQRDCVVIPTEKPVTPRFRDDEQIRSFKEFLAWSKVGRTTAFEMITKGLLRPVRYQKKLLFPESECIAWLYRLSGMDK